MIVSREGEAVAVYFQLPFTEVSGLFGREAVSLVGADGKVNLEELSLGTFDDADLLARDVEFSLGDQSVQFEALSMMVHPAVSPFAFETPLDAEIAIAVCGVPLPKQPPGPEELVWVGGWYAYPVSSTEELAIKFPETGRKPMALSVRVFDSTGLERSEEITLADQGTLIVPQSVGWRDWIFGW
ncbi:MAG: hypothetical protein AAGC79_14505 [Pseudomonadota bacterium]